MHLAIQKLPFVIRAIAKYHLPVATYLITIPMSMYLPLIMIAILKLYLDLVFVLLSLLKLLAVL